MNKAELVNVIAEKSGLTKVDAKKALDAFINVSKNALQRVIEFHWSGLDHFLL